jgi:hypothetical protein
VCASKERKINLYLEQLMMTKNKDTGQKKTKNIKLMKIQALVFW